MSKFICFIFLFHVASCGKEDKRRTNCVMYGDQCHEQSEDNSFKPVAGPKGEPGDKGSTGKSGYNVIFSTLTSSVCSNGGQTILIAQDINNNNVIDPLIDLNIRSLDICNGSDGQDGTDGQDGADGADAPPSEFTPVEIVDPCGDALGVYDEVFLRLFNGQLLWSLSDNQNGLNTRFSLAVVGSWQTTDGSHCFFSVDSNYNLYNEHY